MDTPTKRCTKCGQEFPATLEFFYKWKYSHDGLSSQCKTCLCERARQWRIDHLDKVRETKRQYRKNHQEIIAEKQRQYNKTHREKAAERSHRWNERHPGKANERARQWYQEHREYVLEREHQWYNANRNKIIEKRRPYEEAHRQEASERSRQWVKNNPWKARESRIVAVLENATHQDRIQPPTSNFNLRAREGFVGGVVANLMIRSMSIIVFLYCGGSNAPENLVISCAKCNLSKSNKLPGEFNGRLRN